MPTEIVYNGGLIPQATFGAGLALAKPDIATTPQAAAVIWHSPADGAFDQSLEGQRIGTMATPAAKLFIGGAAVTLKSRRVFMNPFRRGEIRGRVSLQERRNSLGAFLEIDRKIHFVERDGTFRAEVAAGALDIYIRAPGYVPVLVAGVFVEPGNRVNIPALTLPFGDANADGIIDIYDLSISAGNYGRTIQRKSVP